MAPTTAMIDVVARVRAELRSRRRRWRSAALPIAQAALAAGLAWVVAVKVAGHPSPFFAPIAAVVCLGITLGQRLRRGTELVAGVTIGAGVGDLLISTVGTGAWQIALVVALAMSAAVLLDGGAVITIQAAASAVLVSTLYLPGGTSSGVSRMVDAFIGGAAGLVVAALFPPDPLRAAQRNAGRVLGELATALRGVAGALRDRDREKATAVLERARQTQRMVDDLRTALQTGAEIAVIAPIRWHRRPDLDRYRMMLTPVDHALRNTRVLVRRAVAALRDGEPIPEALPHAIAALAEAVEELRAELAAGREPTASRSRMQAVARSARPEMVSARAFSASVVLAQLRSTVADMLQATGMAPDEAHATLPPAIPVRP